MLTWLSSPSLVGNCSTTLTPYGQLNCKVSILTQTPFSLFLSLSLSLSPSSSSSSSSWLWKGILKSHSFISKGACYRIHSSSSLPIWSSTWIPTIASFSPTPSPLLLHPFPNLLVSNLFTFNPILSASVWNIPLLASLFDSFSIREILKINFSTLSEDKFIWTPTSNGAFYTKFAHMLINSQRIVPIEFPLSPSQ